MNANAGRVLYIVRTWVPEDMLESWDEWHTSVHVRQVTDEPQVRRAWKYRVVEDNTPAEWPAQYVTIFEFDSLEDFESYRSGEAATRLRADYSERFGSVGKISRQVLIEVARVANYDQ
jgi:hypothetical protein